MLYFLPVGCLMIVADEANHHHIIHQLDDGIGSMNRSAVVDEKEVKGMGLTHSPV